MDDHNTHCETKVCKKCDSVLPATTEYFHRAKGNSDGLCSVCKDCNRARARAWTAANPERNRARSRAWNAANKERKLASSRAWKSANKERHRENARAWYAANPERAKETRRAWVAANPERARKSNRAWRAANKERKRVSNHSREARKRGLPDDFTHEQEQFALDYFGNVCAVCGRPFYDLFSERTLSLDHWIPLKSDNCPGTTATNMIPLCHGIDGCNTRKNARDPNEWLMSQFGKRKAREILARIEAYFDTVRLSQTEFSSGDNENNL